MCSEFNESFKLNKKYGIIEWKLLNGICFDYDRLEERDIEECINLWKMLNVNCLNFPMKLMLITSR